LTTLEEVDSVAEQDRRHLDDDLVEQPGVKALPGDARIEKTDTMLYQRSERDRVDRVFHALADPSRRVIVERLSRGPASVSELAQPLPMSLPAVVQHIQVLETSGLVRSEKVGRVRTCRIEPAALRPLERWISARRSSWERRLDSLGEYLAESKDDPREGGKR
jgi:DNA-binding transcriptional ArsR family regulator